MGEVRPLRVEIDLRVVFSTPLSIGSGAMADSLADKPIVKDATRLPVIPASTLKGRLRHECERIVRALTGDENAVCHGPAPVAMCPLDPLRLDKGKEACPVCQIFGSPWRPSALQFSDLHWELAEELETEPLPKTTLRYGVSIRRARRVAEPERLFTIETFAPTRETAFTGRIVGYLPDDDYERYWRVGLIVGGLRAITSLGGGRSRGLGWCRIEVTAYDVLDGDRLSIEDERLQEALRRWSSSRSQ